jgi:hypothetical protein
MNYPYLYYRDNIRSTSSTPDRSTYSKPNHPDLNQSVPNYDENDFWIDIEHQLKPAKLEIEV